MQEEEAEQLYVEEHLIEQIIFYGILQPEKLSIESLHKGIPRVGVKRRYRKGVEVNIDNADEQLQMWAYPDGIKIYDHNLRVINDDSPEMSFGKENQIKMCLQTSTREKPADYIYSFVHTDYSLKRTYFSALCWHETKYIPFENGNQNSRRILNYSNSLPKCTLGELENQPCLIDKDRNLIYIPHLLIVGSLRPIFNFQRQMLRLYNRNVIAGTSNPVVNSDAIEYFKDLTQVAGYPKAELEFDNGDQKYLKGNKQYRQIKKEGLNSFYTSFLFLPKSSAEIDTVQVADCLNSSIKVEEVYLPRQCFQIPNIDIIGMIRKVGVKNFMTLWKNILLEKHILVFSMNNHVIVDLFESLLYMLEPIKWENIYIPFLPFHLVSNLEAIQSYLVGMSKIHMDYVIEHYQHQVNDLVLFDLDQNILIEKTSVATELPVQLRDIMYERLAALGFRKDTILGYLFRKSGEVDITDNEKILAVKCIFFDGLIYLLNNYRPFASLKEGDVLSFDRDGYKSIFSQKSQWTLFAEQLIETMIFTRLCQYHLYEQKILRWNQSNLGGLFVYCQNILSDKNPKGFWELPPYSKGTWKWSSVPYNHYLDYVLGENLKKIGLHKRVYYVQNYLIKYLKWLEMKIQNEHFLQENTNEAKSLNGLHYILNFLFPWTKQFTNPQKIDHFSLEECLKDLTIIDLGCLFGIQRIKRHHYMKFIQKEIQRELKAYREKKNRKIIVNRSNKKPRRRSMSRVNVNEERFSV